MEHRTIIAVLTDFGPDSFYTGVMKAVLFHAAPDNPVADISHSVSPRNVAQASFVLDTVCDYFPEGTVFLTVVDPGVGGERRNLIVQTAGRYFVGPDNGVFTEVVARAGGAATWTIDDPSITPYRLGLRAGRTFLGRDVFAPAAAALAAGRGAGEIGRRDSDGPVALDLTPVVVKSGRVRAAARYVDSFGNVLFAVTRAHLQQAFGDTPVEELTAEAAGHKLGNIGACYEEKRTGSLAAVINSWDRIEIAVPGGSAVERFGRDRLSDIVIEIRAAG